MKELKRKRVFNFSSPIGARGILEEEYYYVVYAPGGSTIVDPVVYVDLAPWCMALSLPVVIITDDEEKPWYYLDEVKEKLDVEFCS